MSGRAALTVAPAPRRVAPAPALTPATGVIPATTPAPALTSGVFPVRGPHSYGDGFGASRSGHLHQGADVLAAEGTPACRPWPAR